MPERRRRFRSVPLCAAMVAILVFVGSPALAHVGEEEYILPAGGQDRSLPPGGVRRFALKDGPI